MKKLFYTDDKSFRLFWEKFFSNCKLFANKIRKFHFWFPISLNYKLFYTKRKFSANKNFFIHFFLIFLMNNSQRLWSTIKKKIPSNFSLNFWFLSIKERQMFHTSINFSINLVSFTTFMIKKKEKNWILLNSCFEF